MAVTCARRTDLAGIRGALHVMSCLQSGAKESFHKGFTKDVRVWLCAKR